MGPLHSLRAFRPLGAIRMVDSLYLFHLRWPLRRLEVSDEFYPGVFRGTHHRTELKPHILGNPAPPFFLRPKGIKLL